MYLDSVVQLKKFNYEDPELNSLRYFAKYDRDTDKIFIYVSQFSKENNFGGIKPFALVKVTAWGDVLFEPYQSLVHNALKFPQEAIVGTIVNKYSKLTASEKRSFYNKLGIDYDGMVNLTANELKDRSEQRKSFIDFVNHLVFAKETYEEKTNISVSVELNIENYYGFKVYSKYTLAYGPKLNYHKTMDYETFREAFNEEKPLRVGRCEEECLDDLSKQILSIAQRAPILTSGYWSETRFSDLTLLHKLVKLAHDSSSNFLKINYVDTGSGIKSEYDQQYKEINDCSLELTESGEIKVRNLDIADKNYKIVYQGNHCLVFLFKNNNKNFSIYNLSNADDNIIYYLTTIQNNGSFKPSYISDLIENNFVPKVADKIELPTKYKESYANNKLAINLYVQLDEKDEDMYFETRYIYKKQEVDKDSLLANEEHAKQILEVLSIFEKYNIPEKGSTDDEETIIRVLNNDLKELEGKVTIYVSDELTKARNRGAIKFNLNTVLHQDWLSVSVSSDELTPEQVHEILSRYKKKKRFFKLANNELFYLDDKSVQFLNSLEDDFDINCDSEEVDVPLYELFKINSYSGSANLNYDDKITEILQDIKNFKDSSFAPNTHYNSILRNYQLDAFKWMSTLKKYNLSGILADDMGLGKTLETISFISSLKENEPILIISPKSLIYNWEHEFHKWDPSIDVHVISGDKTTRTQALLTLAQDKKAVFITTYDSLRLDLSLYEKFEYNLIILDEAQYIKNYHAQKSKAAKSLKGRTKFVLTGTPIENSLNDLWSIFDFLMPKYLYSNDKFKREFIDPITEGDTDSERMLNARISPFILRRVKQDVLKDLPPKIESTYVVEMNQTQRNLYNSYLINARDLAENGDKKSKFILLQALVRLRQICLDPSMFLSNYTEISEKLEGAINLIKDAINDGHKVLVFSAFTKSLEHLIDLLKKEQIKSYYIYGQTTAKERLKLCDNFNKKDDVKVFLISLKAGGTGLNLTGADIIIHLDPWWNVAAENQASDRAHRIGQIRTVNVIKMICKNSIEEKVLKLQEAKKDLMDKFIGEGDKGVVSLSDEDIKFLLS